MMLSSVRSPVILAYHGVGTTSEGHDPRRMLVRAEHLESHIRFLKRHGYTFARASDLIPLLRSSQPLRRTAVLTFDDGFVGWLTVALPLLTRLQVPATFYLCPGLWGRQHPDVQGAGGRLLDRQQARQLHLAGMELGSHSLTHRDLRLLEPGELTPELTRSKAELAELTGGACRTFAYPFGLFDQRVVEAVADAGYELAFTWKIGRAHV